MGEGREQNGSEQAVDERALWLSSMRPHGPLKSQLIAVMVKHYARRAGLEKKVTPHVWRHTCATHLVADGANMVYVQRLLGHRSLRTTQIYARVTVPDLKQTHRRAHPANDRQAGPAPNAAAPLPVASRDDRTNSLCIGEQTMNFDELLTKFLGYLQIRNYSPRTVSDYGYNLGSFFRFLEQKDITDVQGITTATLTGLPTLVLLPADQTRPGPRRRESKPHAGDRQKLLPVPQERGLSPREPGGVVAYAREPQPAPQRAHAKEANRIIDSMDTTTALGYRDRTILEVFYATGIRNQELRRLDVADANLEEELLRVNGGKGGHDRVVPLEPCCLQVFGDLPQGHPAPTGGRQGHRQAVRLHAGQSH